MKLGEAPAALLRERAATHGLAMRVPPATLRLRSPLHDLVDQLRVLYAAYELRDAQEFADIDVRLLPVRGMRRRVSPGVQLIVDGMAPFAPFRLDHALPLFEWGVNAVFAHRMHEHLLLHAAVVERNGVALLLPAWPGCGKSTLAASLACRGWRYLSDEFGVVSLSTLCVLPFPRPAALKNESIGVLRAFAPDAFIGPIFDKTRKGTVAHMRVPDASVRRAHEPATIGGVVFPDFQPNAPATLRPLGQSAAFLKLAHNAFNYEVIGEPAFHAVAAIVRRVPSCILCYGDLAAAHSAIDTFVSEAIDVAA